jgi:hypothetical protein
MRLITDLPYEARDDVEPCLLGNALALNLQGLKYVTSYKAWMRARCRYKVALSEEC